MSNHLITTAYKRDLRTPMRKAVMVLLADKASDDGSGIYASKQTMADELCCSKQAIIDTIKGFVAEGLLVELGQRRAPTGFTIEYGIVVEALEAVPLVKCHADKEARQSTPLTGQPAVPVNEPVGRGQPPVPKPSRTIPLTKRASRLPDDFVVPADWIAWAISEKQWTTADAEAEAASFCDYWQAESGAKAAKLDWLKTFRRWVRNSHRKPGSTQSQGTAAPATNNLASLAAQAARYRRPPMTNPSTRGETREARA